MRYEGRRIYFGDSFVDFYDMPENITSVEQREANLMVSTALGRYIVTGWNNPEKVSILKLKDTGGENVICRAYQDNKCQVINLKCPFDGDAKKCRVNESTKCCYLGRSENVNNTELTPTKEEIRLLKHIRRLDFGKVTVEVKRGVPVMGHQTMKDVKYTD